MGFMDNMRRTLFGHTLSNDAKRETAWQDYGYPQHLEFDNFYTMFQRSGIARAGVMKHVEKTWETNPWIVQGDESDEPHSDWTTWEKAVSQAFRRAKVFDMLKEADWRGRVGRYSALYLVFNDGKRPDEPVQYRNGQRLLRVQPLFESQLTPATFNTDPSSDQYGQPLTYQFTENALGNSADQTARSMTIHADRIHILAEGSDGSGIYGTSALEPGFNSLLTLEKIIGAGGEGFWKAARGAYALKGQADVAQLARMFGCEESEVGDKLNEVASDFSAGFDKMLMLGGMEAEGLGFSVPQPEQFFNAAIYDFSASVSCPVPVLIGQQISQRSSEENSQEWSQTNMSRRKRFVGPNIEDLVRKLMRVGAVPFMEHFYCAWDDLTEPSKSDKLALAEKAANINKALMGSGVQAPFDANELRDLAGFEPNDDLDDESGEPLTEVDDGETADSAEVDEQPGSDDASDSGSQAAA